MPAVAAELSDEERAARVTMGSDQCIVDEEHFFILGNLDVPVRDSEETIRWTVWSTLSKPNFDRTSELWEMEARKSEPPYFGWLSNQIPGYPSSINIAVHVLTQAVGARPKLEVIDESHPLHEDQRLGITPARADELIRIAVHGRGE